MAYKFDMTNINSIVITPLFSTGLSLTGMPYTTIFKVNNSYIAARAKYIAETGVSIYTPGVINNSNPTLKSVAEDITARSGLPISKYSYSNLTDTVRGYHIAKKMPIKDALEPLTAAYRFDIIEEDSKIVGRPYLPSSTSVRTLTTQEVGTQNYD
jgi:hypothetical protein